MSNSNLSDENVDNECNNNFNSNSNTNSNANSNSNSSFISYQDSRSQDSSDIFGDDEFESSDTTIENQSKAALASPLALDNKNTEQLQNIVNSAPDSTITAKVWCTEVVKIVSGYRDGKHLGIVGAALLRNAQMNLKFIIYKTKANILYATDLVSYTNEFHFQKHKSYLQFFENTGIFWSVTFICQTDQDEFLTELEKFGINIKYEIEMQDVCSDVIGNAREQKKYFKSASQRSKSKNSAKLKNECTSLTTSLESKYIELLLTENRSNNSEISLSFKKLENRIEMMLNKIEEINSVACLMPRRTITDDVREFEEKLLFLKEENKKLKQILWNKFTDSHEHINRDYVVTMNENFKIAFIDLNISKTEDLQKLIGYLQEKLQNAESELHQTLRRSSLETQINSMSNEMLKILEIEMNNTTNYQNKLKQLEDSIRKLETTAGAVTAFNEEIKRSENEKIHEIVTKNMDNLYMNLLTKVKAEDVEKEELLQFIANSIHNSKLEITERLKQS